LGKALPQCKQQATGQPQQISINFLECEEDSAYYFAKRNQKTKFVQQPRSKLLQLLPQDEKRQQPQQGATLTAAK